MKTFPEVGKPHALNLDGGKPELWNEIPQVDPNTGEPVTRFVVQQFDGETFVTIDEQIRPGELVTFADVDGDGVDDAIHWTPSTGSGFWLPGNTNGQLAEAGLPFAIEGLQQAKFVDLNGDGAIDATVQSPSSWSELDFHVGDGSGGFTFVGTIGVSERGGFIFEEVHALGNRRALLGVSEICLGFCNGGMYGIVVELNEDDTVTELGRVGGHTSFIDAIDRNGDDLPDVLLERPDDRLSNRHNRVGWCHSPEYGEAEVVQIQPTAVTGVADVDLDGAMDVLEYDPLDDPLTLRFGISGEGLGPAHPLQIDVSNFPGHFGYAQADYDGDGRLDFVVKIYALRNTMAIWTIIPCS